MRTITVYRIPWTHPNGTEYAFDVECSVGPGKRYSPDPADWPEVGVLYAILRKDYRTDENGDPLPKDEIDRIESDFVEAASAGELADDIAREALGYT